MRSLDEAVRRAPDDGPRHRASGTGETERRPEKLEDVDVLAEGVERNIVLAPDGTLFVLGADRFRFYDSDLDGVERDFSDNPDIAATSPAGHPHQPRRLDPEGQPVAEPRHRAARDLRARVQGSRRRGAPSADGELWALDHGPQGGDEINIVRAGQGLRLARCLLRHAERRAAGRRPEERARRQRRTRRPASRSRSTSGCRRSRRRE